MDKQIKQIKITYTNGEEKTVDKAMISTVGNGILITESFGMSEVELIETLAGISFFVNELRLRTSQLN